MKSKKTLQVFEYELPIVITRQKEGGYIAKCKIWSDCYAQAETVEDVIAEITKVAKTLIEIYHEENNTIPLDKRRSSEQALAFTIPIVTQ